MNNIFANVLIDKPILLMSAFIYQSYNFEMKKYGIWMKLAMNRKNK